MRGVGCEDLPCGVSFLEGGERGVEDETVDVSIFWIRGCLEVSERGAERGVNSFFEWLRCAVWHILWVLPRERGEFGLDLKTWFQWGTLLRAMTRVDIRRDPRGQLYPH